MGERKIDKSRMLRQFEQKLRESEKSKATIDKYLRDVLRFMEFIGEGGEITKDSVKRPVSGAPDQHDPGELQDPAEEDQ